MTHSAAGTCLLGPPLGTSSCSLLQLQLTARSGLTDPLPFLQPSRSSAPNSCLQFGPPDLGDSVSSDSLVQVSAFLTR